MKVTFNVECSPEEARAFLGLPDVAPMQQALMADLEQRLRDNIQGMTPDAMLKTWLPAGLQNVEQAQKMFWSQMQQTMTGIATTTTSAMNAFGEQAKEIKFRFMIFAETERLILRSLEREELPRLAELIGVWDVVRWLTVVPFPYTLENAEEFFVDVDASYVKSEPEFYAMSLKSDNMLIGGVGLHAPRTPDPVDGEKEIGYWLGRDFWGQGLMSEAARIVVDVAFARDSTRAVGATTAPGNHASRKVLQKAGLRDLGIMPRPYAALRGSDEVVRWLMTRDEWKQRNA